MHGDAHLSRIAFLGKRPAACGVTCELDLSVQPRELSNPAARLRVACGASSVALSPAASPRTRPPDLPAISLHPWHAVCACVWNSRAICKLPATHWENTAALQCRHLYLELCKKTLAPWTIMRAVLSSPWQGTRACRKCTTCRAASRPVSNVKPCCVLVAV